MARAADTTRRALLATAAGLAGGVAIRAALPAHAVEADPIFALIDEHRRTWEAYVAACRVTDDNDDTVNCLAADAVAERIVRTPPTTAAGAAALLSYVAEGLYDDRGEGTTVFPDSDEYEDAAGRFPGRRSFEWWIMSNCAEALARV